MIIGVVGKPSVGKSTFFKASTLADVEIASYPFTTIKPNEGVGFVRVTDSATFFEKHSNPREGYVMDDFRFVPVRLIDVAGLVPGAHAGEGMGNQFLDDLRQADVLIHVIDASGSTNEKGEAVDAGSYNPSNDVKFLEVELDMWYVGILKKGWDKFARTIQQEKQNVVKALAKQLSAMKVTEAMVEDSCKKSSMNLEAPSEWTDTNLTDLATQLRRLTKPMVIAANKVDTPSGKENIKKLKEEFPQLLIIPCSGESELALREAAKHELIRYIPGAKTFEVTEKGAGALNDKQKAALEFMKKNILDSFDHGTGVQQVLNTAVFELLQYIEIYPGGDKLEDKNGNTLPDCFLMPKNTTALDFAFRLHTDFGKNFVRAKDIKTKMVVGREHQLRRGDVIEIMSSK